MTDTTTDYGVLDFDWIRGTTSPLIVELKIDGTPIPADDVRLSVWNNGGKNLAFRLSLVDNPGSGPGLVSVDTGTYTFQPTAHQTRLLTKTERGLPGKNRYEVEVRNGTDERVYLLGTIAAIGGFNDDESGEGAS